MIFKEAVFDFGGVKDGQVVKFKFEFKEEITLPVEWIRWGCHCTTGTEVVDGKYIAGELDVTKAGVLPNTKTITKGIIVKLKDGEPEAIADPNSPVRAWKVNPKALRQTISLKGERTDL